METRHLGQDEFFDKLAELFEGRKGSHHGAIYLTQKRLTYAQDSPSPTSDNLLSDPVLYRPMPLIFRASNGKSKKQRADKIKLSTIVQPHELDQFYTRYAEVCKAGMMALKPRDRSKKKAKARKRKIGS